MDVGLLEIVAGFVIGFFLFANLLHPGGWLLFLGIALFVLLVYGAIRFVPEYAIAVNEGKNATKHQRRRKRIRRGVLPWNWFGEDRRNGRRRDGEQGQQEPQNRGGRRRE